jgi:pyruvate ferredoxin oxidoreductase alpha subunit
MSALFRARSGALAVNYVYGLGGRDVRVEDMEHVFAELEKIAATGDAGEMYRYMGIRE